MTTYDYDLFTIGAGSGGTRAARLAASRGARVAIAEEHRIGGTCVIRGCVPKKFLAYGASFAQAFEDAAGYGWTIGEAKLDWPTLRDHVARDVDRLSAVYQRNLANAGVDILHERAELIDDHTLRLGTRTVTAKTILIATGGRPLLPTSMPGVEHVITSDQAFGLPALPRRLVIAGGGYIAVEFASIFRALGVDVCLVYRGGTVLSGFDDDVRVQVHGDLERRGVRVITSTTIESVAPRGDALACRLANGNTLDAELVMFAIGRVPHTEGLGLTSAGVRVDDEHAIVVDRFSRTSAPSIFAVGDVTNRLNLTPVAIREAHAFVETAFADNPTAFDHDDVPTAVFTQPPAAAVGLTEGQARHLHGQGVDIYRTVFRPMKHVLSGNQERMLMKLVVRASDQVVLGVHIVGLEAPEMMQLAAIAVKARVTKAVWDSTCALHPTAAEEIVLMRDKIVVGPVDAMG